MKTLYIALVLLVCLVVTSGCNAPVITKQVKPTPPMETEGEKESVRQAIQATKDLILQDSAADALPVLDSLQTKFGKPSESIDASKKGAITSLRETIEIQVKEFREKWNAWLKTHTETDYFSKESSKKDKSPLAKAKSWGLTIIIVLIVWGLIAPVSLAWVAKRVKSKIGSSMTVLEESLKKKNNVIGLKDKALKQLTKSVESIKSKDASVWAKMKPHMKHDSDVKEEIERHKS